VGFFLLAAVLTKHHVVSWNDESRMATIDALAAHHTFAIDNERVFATGDKYRYAGKFYSDKPPILAIGGAAIAFVLEHAGISAERRPELAYYLITLLLVGTSYAAGLMALYETLRILCKTAIWPLCVTIVAGTSTFLLPYSTILNNHVVSGALLAIGFRLLIDPHFSRKTIVAGAAAFALAACIDISFVIFVLLEPLLLARHGLRRTILPFAAATLPFLVIYFAFNVLLSGSLLPPALNVPLWNYPGSAFNSNNLTGLAGARPLTEHLRYALDLITGNHGLFSYMPILLVGVYGFVCGWFKAPQHRLQLAFIAIGCSMYLALYAWSSNDYSGFSYGIRWYAGIVYLAMIPLAFLEDAIAGSLPMRVLFIAATFFSAIVAVVGLADPATPNNIGVAPFLSNVQRAFEGQHHVKGALYALYVLLTVVIVANLLSRLPSTSRLRKMT